MDGHGMSSLHLNQLDLECTGLLEGARHACMDDDDLEKRRNYQKRWAVNYKESVQ